MSTTSVEVRDDNGTLLGRVRVGDMKLQALERLGHVSAGGLFDCEDVGLLDKDRISPNDGPYVFKPTTNPQEKKRRLDDKEELVSWLQSDENAVYRFLPEVHRHVAKSSGVNLHNVVQFQCAEIASLNPKRPILADHYTPRETTGDAPLASPVWNVEIDSMNVSHLTSYYSYNTNKSNQKTALPDAYLREHIYFQQLNVMELINGSITKSSTDSPLAALVTSSCWDC